MSSAVALAIPMPAAMLDAAIAPKGVSPKASGWAGSR
jgi:hypothetical protein